MKIYDEDFLYPLGFLEGEACKEIFLKYYRYDYENRQKEIEVYLAEIIRLCGNHVLTIELLERLHLKAINIYSKLNSSKDPRMLQLYEDLADTYQYFGENREAVCYYGKALEVGRGFLREDNWKLKELEEKRRILRAGF